MKTHLVFFSPKGGTAQCAKALAEGMSDEVVVTDITLPADRKTVCNINEDEVVVFAAPVFGGHPQAFFKEYIKGVKGSNTPAVLLAVYGNRDYDMAFREMYDIAASNGFNVIACVAAVSEHSFNNDIQTGRPDEDDKAALAEFGREIKNKLTHGNCTVMSADDIPQKPVNIAMIGMHGTRLRSLEPGRPLVADNCIKCGMCSRVCPAGIIDPKKPDNISAGCIFCRACARVCPVKAIEFTQESFGIVAADCMQHFGNDIHRPKLWL